MTDALQQRRFNAAVQAALPIFASVVLLTLAAAPFGQWYLAWFALAPWLVAVARAPTIRAAMLRGWLSGVLYFAANLWWLWTASIPGTIVLVLYFALFWSIAAGLIRGLQLLPSNGSEPKRCGGRLPRICHRARLGRGRVAPLQCRLRFPVDAAGKHAVAHSVDVPGRRLSAGHGSSAFGSC